MSIVQFFMSPPDAASSQMIVYRLILDCTVNDMLDIKGEVEDKSVEKSSALAIGVKLCKLLPVPNNAVPNCVIVSSLILHRSISESLAIH